MKNRLLQIVEDMAKKHVADLSEKSDFKRSMPAFEVGDTVDVHFRILEGQKGHKCTLGAREPPGVNFKPKTVTRYFYFRHFCS